MKNLESFTWLWVISQAWTFVLDIEWLKILLQIIAIVVILILLIVSLYKVFLFVSWFEVATATYRDPNSEENNITSENDKSKIVHDYILNNRPWFIVSNRLFWDVSHGKKKTLYITYFIWSKRFEIIIEEYERFSVCYNLFNFKLVKEYLIHRWHSIKKHLNKK